MLPAIAAMAELGSVTGQRPVAIACRRRPGAAPALGELGDYRILREIGRGGMGVVYEAAQISLGRRVALKVLPFAPALDARQLQRFQNEAQAAAHLNHANIVPVYAVGCERGVHYYAMQFIEGQSLSALIEELRRIEGRAGERVRELGTRRRSCWPASWPRGGSPRPGPATATLAATALDGRSEAAPSGRDPGSSPLRSAPRSSTGIIDPHQRLLPHGGPAGHPGGRGARARAPAGRDPPRHQAVEPAGGRARQPLGHRLRAGAVPERGRPDDDRRPAGHAAVHEPRAGAGQVGHGRPPHRHLLAGRDALRAADAANRSTPGATARRSSGGSPSRSPGRRAGSMPSIPRRPGDDRAQGDGQGPGQSLRHGPGAGRRPESVPRVRADPGAAEHRLGAVGEVGPAAARDRGPAGDGLPDDDASASWEAPGSGSGPSGPGRPRPRLNETLETDPVLQPDRPGRARAGGEQPPPGRPASGRMSGRAARLGMELPEAGTERIRADRLSCRDAGPRRGVQPRRPVAGHGPPRRRGDHLECGNRRGRPPPERPWQRRPRRRLQSRRLAGRIAQLRRDHDLGRDDRATDRQSQDDRRRVGGGVQPRRPVDRLGLPRRGKRGHGRHDLGRDDPRVDPDREPPERTEALDLQSRRRHASPRPRTRTT